MIGLNSFLSFSLWFAMCTLSSANSGNFDFESMMKRQIMCKSFSCSTKGEEPVPKSPLRLTSPGCSGLGGNSMSISQRKDDALLDTCCDLRMGCMQICGSSKSKCEKDFEACTNRTCGEVGDKEAREKCESSARVHQMMIKFSGNKYCEEFDEFQKAACHCVAKEKATKSREQFLTDFYKKYNKEESKDKKALAAKVSGLVAKAETSSKFATLLNKLVQKYPSAVKRKKDQKQEWIDKIMKEAEEGKLKDDSATRATMDSSFLNVEEVNLDDLMQKDDEF